VSVSLLLVFGNTATVRLLIFKKKPFFVFPVTWSSGGEEIKRSHHDLRGRNFEKKKKEK